MCSDARVRVRVRSVCQASEVFVKRAMPDPGLRESFI